MTEYHRPVDRANILAHALIDTYAGREYSDGEHKIAYAAWDLEQEGLTCLLKRTSDRRGTIFFLNVFYTDEFYEDLPVEPSDELEEFDEYDEVEDEDEEEGVDPIEPYEISFLAPRVISRQMSTDNIFLDTDKVHERVLWLLEQKLAEEEALRTREDEGQRFWRLVGSYALSGDEAEKLLVKNKRMRRAKKVAGQLLGLLGRTFKEDSGLSSEEMLDAMKSFYAGDHGKEVMKRNQL